MGLFPAGGDERWWRSF